MTTACEQVFGTAELLEAVLFQLYTVAPQIELLCAQLVSRQFHVAIASSPRIQQLLFLRAEPVNGRKPWRLNPLLREHFVPWFVGPISDRWAMPTSKSIQSLDWTSSGKRDAFMRAEASWRRMLVVQTPPKHISVVRFCHAKGGDLRQGAKVSFAGSPAGGVTMGLLYDITESFVRLYPHSQFGISMKNSSSGPPHIILHLLYTAQCCPISPQCLDLVSQGARSQHVVNMLPWTPFKKEVPNPNAMYGTRLDMDIMTDLTPERGGIPLYLWSEWKRERAPISAMESDVW
ncbi:Nn.00g096830.m01.CDS01 [Neocucurbitaria sp. VM-36]